MPRKILASEFAAHFWHRVNRTGGPSACWPWRGAIKDNGYGCGQHGDRMELAHRSAYILTHGLIAAGLVVRHACDNRVCCNPAHLLLGTQRENVRDAIDRGRHVPPPHGAGSAHPRARLSEADVRRARQEHAAGAGCAALARIYGVGETTMGHALAGRSWRDVA